MFTVRYELNHHTLLHSSFIPQHLPMRFLHTVRSNSSSSNFRFPWCLCDCVSFYYNYVNNQQDATNFRLLIFLIHPYMFRGTNSPILRNTFDYIYTAFGRMHRHCCRRQQCRCILPKAVYTDKKCSWGWANLSPETCKAVLKRLINEKVFASCWLFTSLQYPLFSVRYPVADYVFLLDFPSLLSFLLSFLLF